MNIKLYIITLFCQNCPACVYTVVHCLFRHVFKNPHDFWPPTYSSKAAFQATLLYNCIMNL